MPILSVTARAWTLPLRAPFAIARRTAYEAHNVLVTVRTDSSVGQGESAPVAYVTGESVHTVLAAVESVAPLLVGQSVDRLGQTCDIVNHTLPDSPAARAGLETALFDLWGQEHHLSGWQFFGGRQTTLVTDVTIPLVSPDEAAQLARAAWDDGFRALKLKIGHAGGPAEDLARAEAVVRACPDVRLRVDANQAFDVGGAVAFTRELLRMGAFVELLEQPVPKGDWQALKAVREQVSVPVFADEAACTPADVLHLLKNDAVDGVNVKVQKSGLAGAWQIVTLCRAARKQLMIGCMLESGLGIAVAAHLAGGCGAFAHVDLDSHRLLSPVHGLAGGFTVNGDTLEVGDSLPPGGGWGVTRVEETAPRGNNTSADGD